MDDTPDYKPWKRCRRRILFLIPTLTLLVTFAFSTSSQRPFKSTTLNVTLDKNGGTSTGYRHLLSTEEPVPECVPPAIDEFPEDFLTQEQRINGGIVIHLLIVMYLCAFLGIICDRYFVPSLELVSEILHVPTDVAGATFMAIGTSAPELFTSVIGSFITEGDIGIGAIVGSAIFNVIGITGLAGLAVWKGEVPIDWYPISRDSFAYTLSIVALILVLMDNTVIWYEAVALLFLFVLYVVVMVFNAKIERFCLEKMELIKTKLRPTMKSGIVTYDESFEEKTPLIKNSHLVIEVESGQVTKSSKRVRFGSDVEVSYKSFVGDDSAGYNENDLEGNGKFEINGEEHVLSMPRHGLLRKLFWFLTWPCSFLLYITVPDCRKEQWRKFYMVTFGMAVMWIAGITYVTVWMVTLIGFTFGIPDAISGVTILAVGTSVPEIISSILVVRNGLGNMAICNMIGSNVFNIVFCLGAPWLIKTLMSETGTIHINSAALTYMTITLLSSLVLLYAAFIIIGWKLDRKIGFFCVIIYIGFIFLACYFELELTAETGLPTCL